MQLLLHNYLLTKSTIEILAIQKYLPLKYAAALLNTKQTETSRKKYAKIMQNIIKNISYLIDYPIKLIIFAIKSRER